MILKDRPARGKVTAGLLLAAVLVLGLVSVFGTQPAAAEPGIVLAAAPADGQIAPDWVWPLERSDETSLTMTFGEHVHPVTGAVTNHHGVDLAAPAGSEIRAVRAGTVTEAGFDPVYGNRVVIDHGDGYVTTYGHCQRLDVAAGDSVAQGDVIAAVGSTGWSTGPHLHFGAALDGTDVDPLTLLPQI